MITSDPRGEGESGLRFQETQALLGTLVHDPKSLTPNELQRLGEQLQALTDQLQKVQQQVDRSRCRNVDLCDLAPVGYISLTAEGVVREANVTAAAMLGEEPVSLVGQPLSVFTRDEDNAALDRHLRDCSASVELVTCELTLKASDGRDVPVLLRSVSDRDDESCGCPTICRMVLVDLFERKQTEAALVQSRRMLQTVLDTIPARVFWKARDLTYLGCNKAFARDAGLDSPKQIIGKLDTQMPWAAEAELYNADDRQVMASGRPKLNFEEPQTTPTGDHIWLVTTKIPLRDRDGNIVGIMGSYEEITERKRAEEALRASEQLYRTLVENVDLGISYITSGFDVVMTNATMGRLAGKPVCEFVGRKCFESFKGSHDVCAYCPGRQAMATGRPAEVTGEGLRADGSGFHARIQAFPVKDDDGRMVGFIEVVEDVTERHEAALALQESEQKYRNLFETAMVGLYRTRLSDGRFLAVNEACALMLGYDSAAQLEATGVMTPEHYADPRRRDELLTQLHETGRVDNFEITALRRDGSQVEIAVSAVAYPDKGYLEGAIVDITDRKRAEEERRKLEAQVQHAQKLESLGVLAGGIAHDFNNLLVAILGNADLALMDMPLQTAERDSIEEIKKAAKRASELTNQMLAYSGKGQFLITAVDLNDLVKEMGHLLEVSISKNAILTYDLATGLPPIEADASQIRQVVMNLITNASDAVSQASGIIAIQTSLVQADRQFFTDTYLGEDRPEGPYVSLEVSDTGCGMDAEARAKLFDPFYTTKFSGRGLGLAAVLGIVRGHGGAVKVTSAPGEGSVFQILFPAASANIVCPAAAPPAEPTPVTGGTVLVVDDEQSVRNVAELMLSRSGFDVVTAADGREAVEVYAQRADAIDIVLLDMTMPHMGGEEAFRQIRRIRPDAKIILCSGYSEQDARDRFAATGLDGFIQKPYELDKLTGVLRAALNG